MRKYLLTGAMVVVMALVSSVSFAAANKKIVLQISDADIGTQNLVLNVASNLQKAYGLANVDLEIVAFGPGLNLLIPKKAKTKSKKDMDAAKASAKVQDRINSLAANQIRFSACGNTFKKMTKKMGKAPKLNKNAQMVSAGVERIVELQEKGYHLVRP